MRYCSYVFAVGAQCRELGLSGKAESNVESCPTLQKTVAFTLKMATVVCAETLDISQHLTRLFPESLSVIFRMRHSMCSGLR